MESNFSFFLEKDKSFERIIIYLNCIYIIETDTSHKLSFYKIYKFYMFIIIARGRNKMLRISYLTFAK